MTLRCGDIRYSLLCGYNKKKDLKDFVFICAVQQVQ